MATPLQRLRGFETRSRVVYGLLVASSLCALGSAFLLSGQVAVVSFVAFLNFTAGLWIAQSIHSLGHTVAGEPAPPAGGAAPAAPSLFEDVAWERFLRIAVVVAAAASTLDHESRSTVQGAEEQPSDGPADDVRADRRG